MTPRPSHAHLFCASCRTWKHRKLFVARPCGELIRDTVCKPCRKNPYKMASHVLNERVTKGRMNPDRAASIIEDRRLSAAAAHSRAATKHQEDMRLETWRRVEDSIGIARRVLRQMDTSTPEKLLWQEMALALVNEARRELTLVKRTQKNAVPGRMWYSMVPRGVTRLLNLINTYPDGADKAPLQLL